MNTPSITPDHDENLPPAAAPAPDSPVAALGQVAAAPEAVVLLEPSVVLGAVAEPRRLRLVRALAGGAVLSVTQLAARTGMPPDTVSKHLRVLREARILMPVASPDGDGRKQFYEIPALFRRQDAAGKAVLDFGVALLRP